MIGVQAGLRPRPGAGGSPVASGVDAASFRSGRCACLVVLTIFTISTTTGISVMAAASSTAVMGAARELGAMQVTR